jgi:threonine dehydratase
VTTGPDVGPLDLDALRRARDRIRDAARQTPLQYSHWLSDVAGVPVYLKLECWQRTRSFKFRGAYNAVAVLDSATRGRGLVTASAGNHGLALALAARLHHATATVFVPVGTPATKKDRIRRMGGKLREVPGIYDDAAAAARAFAETGDAHFLNAFTDPAVVAGQGTVGLEVVEDLPEVREVLVPVGGGGLGAGVGIAVRESGVDARVLGVQSTATTAMFAAFEAGRVVPVDDPAETLCEGLAGETEPVAYERARRVVDAIHLVDEARIAPAIRALYRNEAVVAEGSGVVGVAAILAGDLHLEGPTAVVISGGNIDMSALARIFTDD